MFSGIVQLSLAEAAGQDATRAVGRHSGVPYEQQTRTADVAPAAGSDVA